MNPPLQPHRRRRYGEAFYPHRHCDNWLVANASRASEMAAYTYDALGRVNGSSANSGLHASYQYDNAGNRMNVTVTGAALNSPPSRVIAVPLNGLAIIPIEWGAIARDPSIGL